MEVYMGGQHRPTGLALALLLASGLVFVVTQATLGAQAQTGSIAGTVEDSSGGSLPGVTVTLQGPSIIREQMFVTTDTGEFHFPAVPPGTYAVSAALQGFTTVERVNVTVNVGGATRADFVMQLAS